MEGWLVGWLESVRETPEGPAPTYIGTSIWTVWTLVNFESMKFTQLMSAELDLWGWRERPHVSARSC
jgi:hypothetical protein